MTPFSGSALRLFNWQQARESTSSIGYTYAYNTLDDPIKPRRGITFQISQDFAGLGADLEYLQYAGFVQLATPGALGPVRCLR